MMDPVFGIVLVIALGSPQGMDAKLNLYVTNSPGYAQQLVGPSFRWGFGRRDLSPSPKR